MEEERMSFRDFLRVPFRQKVVMNSALITVFSLVIIYIAFKTPVYESKVKILVSAEKNIQSPYQRQLYEDRTSQAGLTQSEVVKSAPVLERVVSALHLDQRPLDYEKNFASPFKSVFLELITTRKRNKLAELPLEEQKDLLFRQAVFNLRNRIEIDPVRSTDIFVIKVRDFDPVAAAATANAISRSYVIMDLEQQLSDLMNKYGEKNPAVKQFQDNINYLVGSLNGQRLPDIDAIGPASVKIIEQADIPLKHIGPGILVIIGFGAFLSIALGLALSFIFEFLDPTFKSPQEIETELKMPLLGSIPKNGILERVYIRHWYKKTENVRLKKIREGQLHLSGNNKEKEEKSLLNQAGESIQEIQEVEVSPSETIVKIKTGIETNFDPRVENTYIRSLQNLAGQVYIFAKDQNVKSILVTSATEKEELYRTIGNLGAELAERSKVLLVDANFHGAFPDKFKKSRPLGLSDILEGRGLFAEVIQHIGSKLDLVSTGTIEPNAVFVLGSHKMKEFLEEAKKTYDFVLIACPDLAGFKDAQVVSGYTDATILVAQEELTRKKVFDYALKSLRHKKINILGVILNNHSYPIPKFFYERF